MTNLERAEKITEEIYSLATHWTVGRQPIIDRISSQLDDAVEEARDESYAAYKNSAKEMESVYFNQGFASAREKAAELVEEKMEQNAISTNLYTLPWSAEARKVQAQLSGLAERIRALGADK